ncbi:MAG: hypothetical protein AB8H86_02655 [Polyangiales bacterium]
MSDADQPGAYAVTNTGADGPEEHIPPQSIAPKRASVAPSSAPGATNEERAAVALRLLSQCGPEDEGPALQTLIGLGDAGLAAVESTFPGLLWFHRHLAHTSVPKGRDCGASCRVIAAFGDAAIPTLQRLLVSHDAARYYAVLLATDLLDSAPPAGTCDLAASLMVRVLDVDVGVAEAAARGLSARRNAPAVRAQAMALCNEVLDVTLSPEKRAIALKTLAVLRWRELVPVCIDLLSDADDRLHSMAAGTLRIMSASPAKSTLEWQRWFNKHGAEERVRWLIEGLDADDVQCRSTAHQELLRLYGDVVAYDASMGLQERRDAQRAFRDLTDLD